MVIDADVPVFGDWGDQRPDHTQTVPTPVGCVCPICDEEIVDGDAGSLAPDGSEPHMTPRGLQVAMVALHRECTLLLTCGHRVGLCRCNQFGGMTRRQAGLEVARRMFLRYMEVALDAIGGMAKRGQA